jgi:hypothetical protein
MGIIEKLANICLLRHTPRLYIVNFPIDIKKSVTYLHSDPKNNGGAQQLFPPAPRIPDIQNAARKKAHTMALFDAMVTGCK